METTHRTVLVTDARDSSKAYFSEKADEALVRIERDRALFAQVAAASGSEGASVGPDFRRRGRLHYARGLARRLGWIHL